MKKILISIEEELHNRFKAKCALESITMRDALNKLIEDYVRGKQNEERN